MTGKKVLTWAGWIAAIIGVIFLTSVTLVSLVQARVARSNFELEQEFSAKYAQERDEALDLLETEKLKGPDNFYAGVYASCLVMLVVGKTASPAGAIDFCKQWTIEAVEQDAYNAKWPLRIEDGMPKQPPTPFVRPTPQSKPMPQSGA